MRISARIALVLLVSAKLFSSKPALAQLSQQGPKLVGIGASGNASQGYSVALSADGNTAIVGGYSDSSSAGAAWVWTRSGSTWTQQGSKLFGSGSIGSAAQGSSVSLSGDGNTAIIGGFGDDSGFGAAWIWTRSAGVWTQRVKLVGSKSLSHSRQGSSVALSADGNTAIVGAFADNGGNGAFWVWTKSAGVWTEQGTKLIATDAVGSASQGCAVSLSADGNTALVGGSTDNGNAGAAWVWTRSGSVWTQQGKKLVGSGATGFARQGASVSLSGDGSTAIIGGNGDDGSAGAAWVFTRNGGAWTQQGSKLIGASAVNPAGQGSAVSISNDGNTAIIGGTADNSFTGALWVWRRSSGVWTQQPGKLIGSSATGSAGEGASVSLSSDGNTAIVGGYFDNSSAGAAWIFAAATPQPGNCATMTQQNIFITYNGASSGCFPGKACSANESINFSASTFGYNFACATHTFSWSFGDGSAPLTQQQVSHTYPFAGSYAVKLTVTNSQEAVDVSSTIAVAAGQVAKRRPVIPPTSEPSESATQKIVAGIGGTITLPSGSSVAIPAGALASDQLVTLSVRAVLPTQPSSGVIKGVGQTLSVTFSTDQPFQKTAQTGEIKFVLKYSPNLAAALAGSVPITDIVDDDNFFGLISVPCGSTSVCTVVPLKILQDLPVVRSINVSAVNLGSAIELAPMPGSGAKTWNGTNWADGVTLYSLKLALAGSGSGSVSARRTKKDLILVHGMLSSVENAYSKVEGIRDAGDYGAVLGFDYDWTANLSDSGTNLSQFLTTLRGLGITQTDIEAHSEGGPVALAASCFNNDMTVGTIALLGAPVMGTPAALLGPVVQSVGGASIALSPLLTVLADYPTPYALSHSHHTLSEILAAPFAMDLQPNSASLATFRACVAQKMITNSNLGATHIACVAGTDFTAGPTLMLPLGLALRWLFLLGEKFDGIVNQSSANCVGAGFPQQRVTPLSYPLSHTLLTNDNDVINMVGGVARNYALPLPEQQSPVAQSYIAGSTLTLTATPATGSTFTRWSGACTGTSLICALPMSSDEDVTAVFDAQSIFTLTTSTSGTGSGVITPPGGSYVSGVDILLTATAAAGSTFGGWLGACAGTGTTCTLKMNANKSVTAIFNTQSLTYTLSTSTAGSGGGVVSPSGGTYASGSKVTLTATPNSGSTFDGWSGACSGIAPTCVVTMNANQSVTATFGLVPTTGGVTGIVFSGGVGGFGAFINGKITPAGLSGISITCGWVGNLGSKATRTTTTLSSNFTCSDADVASWPDNSLVISATVTGSALTTSRTYP
jgi:hypothetical protein